MRAFSPAQPPANRTAVIIGGASTPLPDGAVGAWYASDYQATPRRVIRNSVSSTAVSQNLLAYSRRQFNNTVYWDKLGAPAPTVTDDAATAPDGSTEASTLTVTANNWGFRPKVGGNLPAGTYSLCLSYKRNTGTDQTFRLSKDATTTAGATLTATDTWQRAKFTFTLASSTNPNQLYIYHNSGAACNIQICDVELYEGSEDLGPQVLDGHCYLGYNDKSTLPTLSAGVFDQTVQHAVGQIQFGTAKTIGGSGMTFVAALKRTATGSTWHAPVSKVQDYLDFTPSTDVSGAPQTQVDSTLKFNEAGLWDYTSKGWQVVTHRYTGSARQMWLGDLLVHSVAGSVSSFTIRDLDLNMVNKTTSLFSGDEVLGFALWERSLTDEEVRQAVEHFEGKVTAFGSSVTYPKIYCAEGDSITAGYVQSPLSYANRYGQVASPVVMGRNFAVSSSTIATMQTRAAAVDAVLPPEPNGRKFVLSVLIGANDLISLGASTYLTNLASYLDDRRAAGWLVALGTLTPIDHASWPGFNTLRNTVNPTLRTWEGVHCDAIIDFADDATMGPDAAALDTNLYYDGVHPSATGQANLAAIAQPILDAM